MAITLVELGSAPNNGTGDPLRTAFQKVNDSITDLANRTGPAIAPGSVSGSLSLSAGGARNGVVVARLVGDVVIVPTGIPANTMAVYSLHLVQDATGGHTVTYPGGTTHLNGGDGTVNPAANAISLITLVTSNGGATWVAAVADARPTTLDPLMWNVHSDDDNYWVCDRSCSLALGGVVQRGTGTLAFAKALSATPTSFTSVSGDTAFAPGDVLRVTVTGIGAWLAFNITRAPA